MPRFPVEERVLPLLFAAVPLLRSCCAKDLVIRERTSGDQEVLAFLIGFILFLSILVIASLVSRCVWRDHHIASRRHLHPNDSLDTTAAGHSTSRGFLSSLMFDGGADSDCDDDDGDDYDDDAEAHAREPVPPGGPLGERTYMMKYKRLCVRIKNYTSTARFDPYSITHL